MKKKEIDMKALHEQYFELYPKAKVLYFTEDGNCFLQKSPALDHAIKAKIKWEAVDNPAFIKEIAAEETAAKKAVAKAAKKAAQKTLKSWNAEQSDYKKDYSLACDLDLKLDGKSHEVVLAALKTAQESNSSDNK